MPEQQNQVHIALPSKALVTLVGGLFGVATTTLIGIIWWAATMQANQAQLMKAVENLPDLERQVAAMAAVLKIRESGDGSVVYSAR